jgi:hypothetical protein
VNTQQEGLLGVRIKPLKAMTINLESEIGHANQPFTPVSLTQLPALGGRFEYRVKKLTLGAAYKENYNNNSVTLSSYSSHARTTARMRRGRRATGSRWTPATRSCTWIRSPALRSSPGWRRFLP